MVSVIFLDPDSRELYADWNSKARAVVGNLRMVAGAHPDDPALVTCTAPAGSASAAVLTMLAHLAYESVSAVGERVND
jgi:MmyB-like transcription regulator ligand binding domain